MRPIEERRRPASPLRDVAGAPAARSTTSRPAPSGGQPSAAGARDRTPGSTWPPGVAGRASGCSRHTAPGSGGAGAPIVVDETLLDGLAVAKECDEFVYAATYLPELALGAARRDAPADRRRAGRSGGRRRSRPEPAPAAPRTASTSLGLPGGRPRPGTTRAAGAWPSGDTNDPYLVLVSETILQQTQVSRGGPAWEAFVRRFPTVGRSPRPPPADVLRAWRGLGYNRRALNLHRAARIVVDELGGRFRDDVAGLERLPGVGPYTARAVAAIAYGLPVGAVDTNVRRVLGRAVAGDPAALRPAELQALADAVVPPDRPADWTHALMDLGLDGLPAAGRRRCAACPLRDQCRPYVAARRRAATGATAPASRGRARGPHRPVRGRARWRSRRTSRWLRGRILDRLREVATAGADRHRDRGRRSATP